MGREARFNGQIRQAVASIEGPVFEWRIRMTRTGISIKGPKNPVILLRVLADCINLVSRHCRPKTEEELRAEALAEKQAAGEAPPEGEMGEAEQPPPGVALVDTDEREARARLLAEREALAHPKTEEEPS